jgi:hypothetical protein
VYICDEGYREDEDGHCVRVVIKSGAMPEGGAFSGTYRSPTNEGSIVLKLVQTGNSAAGEYTTWDSTGRISGLVDGDTLRFDWADQRIPEHVSSAIPRDTHGKGYLIYTIDPVTKEHLLRGKLGHGNAITGANGWDLRKSLDGKPQ